jgi:exodeoxyribonuclease V gamma subunit
MPVDLIFSNRIEQLASLLADSLYARQGEIGNIFRPARIVVPNRNLAKWLQLHLARRLGVSMNIDFTYLDTVLWDLLVSLAGHKDPPLPVDVDIYTLALLHVFQSLPKRDAGYGPIRAYLGSTTEAAPNSADTRRWQLASRLAHLFLEYELNRPDWLADWRAGRVDGNGMVACQAALYRETLMLCAQLGSALKRPVRSLPHLAWEVWEGKSASSPSPENAPELSVSIFGLSQISTFHMELVHRLRERVRFQIFALNPSEAFWEDVRTPRERRWEEIQGGFAGVEGRATRLDSEKAPEFDMDEHPLLSLWGKPGRENIRRLCEVSDYDFEARFIPAERPDTMLGRLQESLRSADSRSPGDMVVSQDTSIQVVACPGRLREVETVYDRILHQLDRDPNLQMTDIAVLVPSMRTYKPVFDAVFQRRPRRLRYNLVDSLAETESHFGRGVLALLDLMVGRFSRAEVLALMLNPLFLDRWSVEMSAVAAWAGWIEALNIYHSFDAQEKAAGGGAPSPRFTWQQGLRRLRLGRIMETDDRGGAIAAFQGLLPYADLESADLELLERFCLAVEDLHRLVVHLRRLAGGDPNWYQTFWEACENLLPIGHELGGEAAIRKALGDAFDNLSHFTAMASTPHGDGGGGAAGALSTDLMRAFISSHLRGLSTAHGEYLTGGVTLAALQPMRPIPYEIIYILGMEEGGGFPGRADNSSLDLRLAKRRRGDVSTPERNNYLFLEALLSGRQQLVITYVCRDLQKDRDLMPCAPVHQLKRFIADHLIGGGAAFAEQRIPLRGADPAYLDPPPPLAWTDPLVNASLLDTILALRTTGNWPPPEDSVPAELKDRVAELASEGPAPFSGPTIPTAAAARIFVEELCRFVRNPIPTKLKRHLEVSAVKPPLERLVENNDEPFSAVFPIDYLVVGDALELWLADCWRRPDKPSPAVDHFQKVFAQRALQGELPEGAFAELDHRRLAQQVATMSDTLRPLLAAVATARRRYRHLVVGHSGATFGRRAGSGGEVARLPAVLLPQGGGSTDAAPTPLEISGEMHWLWQDVDGRWHGLVLACGRTKPPRRPSHHLIQPLLTYLALRCAEPRESAPGAGALTLYLAARRGIRPFCYHISPEVARRYLLDLASRYLDPHTYRWLPFDVVTQGRLKVQQLPPAGPDAGQRRRFLEVLMEAWDEGGDYLSRLARPRFDLDCLAEAQGRVGIFFTTEAAEE